MENRLLICCHDSLLIGTRSECDRFMCQEGKHSPTFNLYFHKAKNVWLKIEILFVLVDVTNAIFVRKYEMFLQSCKLFDPKTSVANNQEKRPYQPVL